MFTSWPAIVDQHIKVCGGGAEHCDDDDLYQSRIRARVV